MGWVYRQTDRVIIFCPDSFEGEADLLVDEVVAVALAVSRVQHIILFVSFFTGVRVFQRFLFVLPDAVGGLDEVVVADRFYPGQISPVVEPFVVVTETLVHQFVVHPVRHHQVFGVRIVQSFVIGIA